MAKKSFLDRLNSIFSSNATLLNIGGNQLKRIDPNHTQLQFYQSNLQTGIVDRFNRMYTTRINPALNYTAYQAQQSIRIQSYANYEAMDADSIIASALDIYADESTLLNSYGEILTIKTDNGKVREVLENLFYDILNIEFNLWTWTRNMVKYGDFYLKLNVLEGHGIIGVIPISPYAIIRMETDDPEHPVKYMYDEKLATLASYSSIDTAAHGRNGKVKEYDEYEIAHFRLITDSSFLPYGRSILEPGRKTWEQITLLEDAQLLNYIMRAPLKYVFKIDIGNIPPNEVDAHMETIISQLKKTPFMDEATGEYNLNFNMQNMLEDFYFPVRGTQTATSIDALDGRTTDYTPALDLLRNKLFASLKVPSPYLGYVESVDGKATLAALDLRFARTIDRMQRIMVSELTKMAIIHLYSQGFGLDDVSNFSLHLSPGSSIFEREKQEIWGGKLDLASKMKDSNLMPSSRIYTEIFDMSEDEIEETREELIKDKKFQYRIEQIATQGEDPANKPKENIQGQNGEDQMEDTTEEPEQTEGVNDILKKPYGDTNDRTLKNYDVDPRHHYKGDTPLALEQKYLNKSVRIDKMIRDITKKLNRK